jgi:protoheme IX farnesyltransferase
VLDVRLIFMWTPPHFWALALFMRSDYDDAKVPMLTVTHGRRATRRQIWIYTLLLAPVALGLALHLGRRGRSTWHAAGGSERLFLKGAFAVWRRDEGTGRGGQLRGGKAPSSAFR